MCLMTTGMGNVTLDQTVNLNFFVLLGPIFCAIVEPGYFPLGPLQTLLTEPFSSFLPSFLLFFFFFLSIFRSVPEWVDCGLSLWVMESLKLPIQKYPMMGKTDFPVENVEQSVEKAQSPCLHFLNFKILKTLFSTAGLGSQQNWAKNTESSHMHPIPTPTPHTTSPLLTFLITVTHLSQSMDPNDTSLSPRGCSLHQDSLGCCAFCAFQQMCHVRVQIPVGGRKTDKVEPDH